MVTTWVKFRFDGKNDNGGDQLYAKITGKTSDVSLGTEDGLIETAVVKDGTQTIVARQTGTALKLINDTGLEVDGDVGIGTTAPAGKLDVQTANGERVTFTSGGSNEHPQINLVEICGQTTLTDNATASYAF